MASLQFDYPGDIPDEPMGPETADEPSLASRDLMVPSKQLESSDWHNDLHDEIGWMRAMFSAEIDQEYGRVCKLLSEMPESATLKEDKSFLELAKDFLKLTRDDKIKWHREESIDIVRRIKSYLLRLRRIKGAEQSGEQLSRPVCQDEKPDQLLKIDGLVSQRMADETAFPVSSENLSTWKGLRLTERHYLMFDEFLTLKEEFLHVVKLAYRMYSRLARENGKKYLPLARDFEFCVKFLRCSRSDLLLVSEDQFEGYARKIRTLVTGDASTESWYLNRSSSTNASQPTPSLSRASMFEVKKVDWKEDMHKAIASARETELPDIMNFYFYEVHSKKPASDAELKELKGFLELAMDFLELTREDEIGWSWNQCYDIMTRIRLYALRYRNKYLEEESEEEQQSDSFFASGSGDSAISIEEAVLLEDMLNKEIENHKANRNLTIEAASNDPLLQASSKRKKTAAE